MGSWQWCSSRADGLEFFPWPGWLQKVAVLPSDLIGQSRWALSHSNPARNMLAPPLSEGGNRDPWLLKYWGHNLGLASAHNIYLLVLRDWLLCKRMKAALWLVWFLILFWIIERQTISSNLRKILSWLITDICFTLVLLSNCSVLILQLISLQTVGSPKSHFHWARAFLVCVPHLEIKDCSHQR